MTDIVDLQVPDKANSSYIVFTQEAAVPLTPDEQLKYAKMGFFVCCVAFFFTVSSSVIGIIVGIISNSSSFLGFGLDGSVDILGGIFIIWRFWGITTATDKDIVNLEIKEKQATVLVAMALILVSLLLYTLGIYHLATLEPPTKDYILLIFSGTLGACLGVVAVMKFWIAHKLNSLALMESGVCNISGTVLSIGVIIASSVHLTHPEVWYLDPMFSLIVGCVVMIVAIHSLVKIRSYFWWKKAFWVSKTTIML